MSDSLLGQLLRSRLEGASPEAQSAIKTAAVIGETFTLSLIARVCPDLTPQQLNSAKQVGGEEAIKRCTCRI